MKLAFDVSKNHLKISIESFLNSCFYHYSTVLEKHFKFKNL